MCKDGPRPGFPVRGLVYLGEGWKKFEIFSKNIWPSQAGVFWYMFGVNSQKMAPSALF